MTSPCEGNNSIKFLKNVTYFLHSENDFFFFFSALTMTSNVFTSSPSMTMEYDLLLRTVVR